MDTRYRKGDRTMVARRAKGVVKGWLEKEEASCKIVAEHKAKVAAALAKTDGSVARMMTAAVPPADASAMIIPAPARGPQVVQPQFETVETDSGPRQRRATVDGYHPVQRADAFDIMALQYRNAGGKGALFTVAQVLAGREYGALHERVAAEGVRCASLEGMPGGDGSGRDWIEGVIARSDRLARMRAAIGDDMAMVQLNARGKRRSIPVRSVVDAVCIKSQSLGQVLRDHGWYDRGDRLEVMQRILKAALNRLYGT